MNDETNDHADGPSPVGPLGSAMADLVEGTPAADFTAWSVIGEVRRRRSVRRQVAGGLAAGVAGIGLLVGIGVLAVGGNASDTATSAMSVAAGTTSSSSSSSAASAFVAAPGSTASSGAESLAATGQRPDQVPAEGGGASLASASCAEPTLSAAQQSLVGPLLDGYRIVDRECVTAPPSGDVVGAGVFTAYGVPSVPSVSVIVVAGELDCADLAGDATGCADIPGRPGVRGASGPTGSVVVLTEGGSSVVVSTDVGTDLGTDVEATEPQPEPFSLDTLAEVAQALAATR